MKAFYSLLTVQADFATVKEYDDIDGRRVALIIGQNPVPAITAIDATEDPAMGHEVLAILELNAHDVHDETRFSEGEYWQSEHLQFEPLRSLMRANLAARCGLTLLEGDELANVKAAEATARRLQMYKIMRQEPPETIANATE